MGLGGAKRDAGSMTPVTCTPPTPTSVESIDDSDNGEMGLLLPTKVKTGLTVRVKTVYDAKEVQIDVPSAETSVGEVCHTLHMIRNACSMRHIPWGLCYNDAAPCSCSIAKDTAIF